MNYLVHWIGLVVLSVQVCCAQQMGDLLIVEGDTFRLYSSFPISKDQQDNSFDESSFPHCTSWQCAKGYFAIWGLQNDSLFLTGLMNCCFPEEEGLELSSPPFAEWITAELIFPFGKKLKYLNDGYGWSYEYEKGLAFKNGLMDTIVIYDNSRTILTPFTETPHALADYLIQSLNWQLIDTCSGDELRRTIILSITLYEDGTVNKIEVKRESSNRLLIEEAIRVIAAIPQWSLFYRMGVPVFQEWNIPVNYLRLQKRKEAQRE